MSKGTPRGRYNTGPETIAKQMADYERRLRALEAGGRAGNTSVDSGTFTISGGSFKVGPVPTVYMGPVGTSWGWIFRRDSGVPVFELQGDAGDQFWAFRDESDNIIFSDDTVAGSGMARPYLPVPFYPHYNTVANYQTTTSATFTGVWLARLKKQQPYVVVVPLVRSSDGSTTGEVQLRDNTNGIIIDGPNVVTAGSNVLSPLGPATLTGNYMDEVEIEIQMRRTAGAGTIGCIVYNAYQRQS